MDIFYDYSQCEKNENTILTVGTFDGLHVGHRKIIDLLVEHSAASECRSCMITFKPHPQVVVQKEGKKNIRVLTPIEEKIDILKGMNIDQLIIIPFTKEFSMISAEHFVKNILIDSIGMKEMVVGYDHAFGKDRSGSLQNLKEFGGRWGFGVTVVPPHINGGSPVSSTRLRKLIAEGNIEQANLFLGRPYQLIGKVVSGEGRGRVMNYPTANISLNDPNKLIIPDGIYVCEVVVRNRIYKGMLSVGFRPTFPNQSHAIEVYIMDFEKDIYGESIQVRVLQFLRKEIGFGSKNELIAQMDADRENTVAYFSAKKVISSI